MELREAKLKLALDFVALAAMLWILTLREGNGLIAPAIFTVALLVATAVHARAVRRLSRLAEPTAPAPRLEMSLGEACEELDRATEDAKARAQRFQAGWVARRGSRGSKLSPWGRVSLAISNILWVTAAL